jgi:hypothetical protein
MGSSCAARPVELAQKHGRVSPGRPGRRASWPDFTYPASGADEASFDDLGPEVTAGGSRRSKIIDGA